MQLSLRLSAIAGLVTRGYRLVDVGCDHGYLPVSLYLDGKIPGAIAMDVRKGPLSRAQEHISQYGLDAYIETRLSDGLEALKPGEGETLVFVGLWLCCLVFWLVVWGFFFGFLFFCLFSFWDCVV